MSAPSLSLSLPTWRGRVHLLSFVAMVPAGVAMVVAARGAGPRVAVGVFALSMAAVFGVSAAYHHARRPDLRNRLRRADHSMIYVLIAGTYTPVCLLALPPAWGLPLLVVAAIGAAAGVALKVGDVERHAKVGGALYLALGWAAVVALPVIARSLSVPAFALLLAGGLAYTVGAIVLFTRWPDPWPSSFGYHEVWHVFTVVAGGCHFAMVWLVAT